MKIEMRSALSPLPFGTETMAEIARVLQYAAAAEQVPKGYGITLGFTDDAHIQIYNREFRATDRATDVLSFPMTADREEWQHAEIGKLKGLNNFSLGDILISVQRCAAQAREYGHDFRREICFLALHGFLHLLGYDHIEEADRLEMEATAEKYLTALGVVR